MIMEVNNLLLYYNDTTRNSISRKIQTLPGTEHVFLTMKVDIIR